VLEWWKLLVAPDDRADLTPQAAAKAFERFTSEAPVLPDDDEKRLCAVVGASRNLLESPYGDLIDAHDLVFRVNRARTGGFEDDVGERTTHHVMWPRELEETQYDLGAVLLMNPVVSNVSDVFDRIETLVGGFGWVSDSVRLLHPEFVKYLREDWTGGRGQ
jgi:hypothetical protein